MVHVTVVCAFGLQVTALILTVMMVLSLASHSRSGSLANSNVFVCVCVCVCVCNTCNTYILWHTYIRMYTYIRIYIHAYVRIYVCHVCMYGVCVYTYVFIHTSFVLISPPIPYIPSWRSKGLHILRPNKILSHKRARSRVPPCNDLENVFFIFLEAITFIFCVLTKFYFMSELTHDAPLTSFNFFLKKYMKQSLRRFFIKQLLHKWLKDITPIYNI
jgi:hypothetical protein